MEGSPQSERILKVIILKLNINLLVEGINQN